MNIYKKKCFLLFIVFFILMIHRSEAVEKSYIMTCSGNAVDGEIDMYIDVSATPANTNNLTGNFDITNARESWLNIDVPKSPLTAHKWFVGRASHSGIGYIQFHSVRGDTLIVNSALNCVPHVDNMSLNLGKEVSFLIGALTVIAFVLAFLSAKVF